MMRWLLASAVLFSQNANAQNPSERTVQVTGVGIVQTVPDIANLDIYLRGEGPTPDAATAALSAKQKAVSTGVAGLLGPNSDFTTSNVTVIEARGGGCADARGYGIQPRLSSGECAVAGFIATMQARVRTQAVEKAATAAGLASRLGASDARLQGFALSDPKAAQGRASAAAISDARQRAEALATGAGLQLGPIVTVHDQPSFDITVSASRIGANAPAAPPAPRVSPVVLDTKPTPIETRAQVTVTYALLP